MHDLGTLGPPYSDSEGLGINDSGQVAGTSYTTDRRNYSHLYGRQRRLTASAARCTTWERWAERSSSGHGINDSGQVTGFADTTEEGTDHAFLWKPTTPNGVSGTMHDLGALGRYATASGMASTPAAR